MKRLFVFIFFLIMTFHATADEVGNTTFVTEPKAEPLFTSKGGDLSLHLRASPSDCSVLRNRARNLATTCLCADADSPIERVWSSNQYADYHRQGRLKSLP